MLCGAIGMYFVSALVSQMSQMSQVVVRGNFSKK